MEMESLDKPYGVDTGHHQYQRPPDSMEMRKLIQLDCNGTRFVRLVTMVATSVDTVRHPTLPASFEAGGTGILSQPGGAEYALHYTTIL